MEPRSVHYLADACGGTLVQGDGEVRFCGVSTDSRTVGEGQAFVALKGDRFDGHRFADQACRAGASVVVVERGNSIPDGGCRTVVTVDDSRVALGRLAATWRAELGVRVVAVAGSNGKTTTKELVAGVVGQRFKTMRSRASYNNDIGVPLTLLQLGAHHQVGVVEVGTNHPGELAPLVRMAQPRYGVLTSLGREHLEYFGDVDGVVEEEGWLAELLPANGVLFLHADSPLAGRVAQRCKGRVVRVGFDETNDWRAEVLSVATDRIEFRVSGPRAALDGRYRLAAVGRHQVLNALLAIAVGAELGVDREDVELGLAGAEWPPHRMQCRLVDGVWLMDDAYNANVDSVVAALATLRDYPCAGRRVAILGDMAESGNQAAAFHEEVAHCAAEAGVEVLWAVGCLAEVTCRAARAAGVAETRDFSDVTEVTKALEKTVRAGDVVLIKASRGVRLERIGERLRNRAGVA